MAINKLRLLAAAMLVVVAFQTAAWGQESSDEPGAGQSSTAQGAQRREDAAYYMAVYFDYKPGKTGEAFKLIEKYFIPVDEAAKRFVFQFRPMTGVWDEVAFFPLKNGPEALAWSPTPSDAAWNAIFVEQVGSQERVDEIWREFDSLVARTRSELVVRPAVYKAKQN